MSGDTSTPPLGETKNNRLFRIAASIPGVVPLAGPIIQAVICETIPNIRIERIETYIRYLQDQIEEIQLKSSLETPEGLDTFEEGMWQSARSVSEARTQNIAVLVAKGLSTQDVEQLQARHYLRIINQIGDEEMALLTKMARGDAFVENGLLVQLYEPHLSSLGLLEVISEDYNGDQVGSLKGYGITKIGKEFIEYLGLTDTKT